MIVSSPLKKAGLKNAESMENAENIFSSAVGFYGQVFTGLSSIDKIGKLLNLWVGKMQMPF